MPFVAVIGGIWNVDPAKAEAARNSGRVIGRELAKAGFGLVVYFSDAKSLEPYVVAGFMETPPAAPVQGTIRVRYAYSQRGQVQFPEEATAPQGFFDHQTFAGDDWEAPFYRSLITGDEVDAVLLLGGANSVLIAGQIAVARPLPILAVDEFDGSAGKIWKQLGASKETARPSWTSRTPAEHVARLRKECEALAAQKDAALIKERRGAELLGMAAAQQKRGIWAAAAFLSLLVISYVAMVRTSSAAVFSFVLFLGLVTAGATGALILAVLTKSSEHDPFSSLLMGSVAGFVVGIAYLVPQFAGAQFLVEPGGAKASTAIVQFVSSILVAFSAGAGFDTVITRLREQAKSVPIGPRDQDSG
jgi:hypothetical protein